MRPIKDEKKALKMIQDDANNLMSVADSLKYDYRFIRKAYWANPRIAFQVFHDAIDGLIWKAALEAEGIECNSSFCIIDVK